MVKFWTTIAFCAVLIALIIIWPTGSTKEPTRPVIGAQGMAEPPEPTLWGSIDINSILDNNERNLKQCLTNNI